MITGRMMRDGIISAANNISNHEDEVNALNVFPVPDGDTGSNLSLTISGAAEAVSKLGDEVSVDNVITCTAEKLFEFARGNSGVILSLIFRGIAKGLMGCECATSLTIAKALSLGAENAYDFVSKPAEGTILTVIKATAREAMKLAENESSAVKVFAEATECGKLSLKKTAELLPVLKRTKKVDAGGLGLVYIFDGMRCVFENDVIIAKDKQISSSPIPDNEEYEGEFGYCTECMIDTGGTQVDTVRFSRSLKKIGDCVFVVSDRDFIKVHVHTDRPDEVLKKSLASGELINVKIDNMRRQSDSHTNSEKKKIGLIAVVPNEKIGKIFRELGADETVTGGKTMNPTAGTILRAVNKINAESIFIFPNNKNVIMTAKTVSQNLQSSKKSLYVIETANIPEGISGIIAAQENETAENNISAMKKAIKKTDCVELTFASKDSRSGNRQIKKGDILALENGKITGVGIDVNEEALKALRRVIKKNTVSVTLFYGKGATETAACNLRTDIEQKLLSDGEVTVVHGGQEIYYYIISLCRM